MMNKIYKKNEVTFAIIMIIIYVIGSSIAESIAAMIGVEKLVPAFFHVSFTIVILEWIKKNGYENEYGLILPRYNLRKVLFFIPLIIIACFGLLTGIKMRYSFVETILFVISMLCVGFLEEIIFRGFLFVGMSKSNLKSAIIVSSITFGIGHIVNLFNGQHLPETVVQILFAIVVGFTLVILFYKGKSLIPCIIFHGLNNALSAIEKTNAEVAEMFSMSEAQFVIFIVSMFIVILSIYSIFILKKLDWLEEKNENKDNSSTSK